MKLPAHEGCTCICRRCKLTDPHPPPPPHRADTELGSTERRPIGNDFTITRNPIRRINSSILAWLAGCVPSLIANCKLLFERQCQSRCYPKRLKVCLFTRRYAKKNNNRNAARCTTGTLLTKTHTHTHNSSTCVQHEINQRQHLRVNQRKY